MNSEITALALGLAVGLLIALALAFRRVRALEHEIAAAGRPLHAEAERAFVRIRNRLPQTYIVSIIRVGDETSVEQVLLDGQNRASIPLAFNRQVDEIILVVSGSSRYTRQKAGYQFSIAIRN